MGNVYTHLQKVLIDCAQSACSIHGSGHERSFGVSISVDLLVQFDV